MIKLYDYFRSSASYRVRIALNLKEIPHELIPVHLVNNGGEQHSPEYVTLNPQHLVPTLVDGDFTLSQSLAIIDYLEEKHPTTSLLPSDIRQKAIVKQMAQLVAIDIHPLNNLRVLQYLADTLEVTDAQKSAWYQNWIIKGFSALETLLSAHQSNGQFCFGNTPTLADLCLIPQVYNAYRFECPMDDFPIIKSINEHCLTLPAFEKASP